jgi:hypothetical protein
VTADWTAPAWAVLAGVGLVVALVLALALSLARSRRRTARALAAARHDAEALREQVEAIERRLAEPAPRQRADAGYSEYTITTIGREEPEAEPVPMVPGPLFADLVLRESVVQAASLVAGLRRALAPETRNRIRFEMRQEVKRARRQRRADLRQARREFEARQRAAA